MAFFVSLAIAVGLVWSYFDYKESEEAKKYVVAAEKCMTPIYLNVIADFVSNDGSRFSSSNWLCGRKPSNDYIGQLCSKSEKCSVYTKTNELLDDLKYGITEHRGMSGVVPVTHNINCIVNKENTGFLACVYKDKNEGRREYRMIRGVLFNRKDDAISFEAGRILAKSRRLYLSECALIDGVFERLGCESAAIDDVGRD